MLKNKQIYQFEVEYRVRGTDERIKCIQRVVANNSFEAQRELKKQVENQTPWGCDKNYREIRPISYKALETIPVEEKESSVSQEDILNLVDKIMKDTKIVHKHRALNRNLKQLFLNSDLPVKSKVTCKDCKYLMFSDCYGECSKAYRGIVSPNDSCEYGERKDKNDQ